MAERLRTKGQWEEDWIVHFSSKSEYRRRLKSWQYNYSIKVNVLGLTFDSKLNCGPQVSCAIKGANNSLPAIRMIRKYFKTSEIIQLLTSNFYSKLYYGSEIWHLPTLNSNCKKILLSASANALKLCNAFYNPNISYVDLQKLHKRALPNNFCTYFSE